MMVYMIFTFAFLTQVVVAANAPQLERYEAEQVHMGVKFTIVAYVDDAATANKAFAAAFARIESLDQTLSDYDPNSELSRLSRSAPTAHPVRVSDDLWLVLSRSNQLSEKTNGAFDVTVGPLTRLWRRARLRKELPDPVRFEAAKLATSYKRLELIESQQQVALHVAGMRLDLGGIAKGYAADEALAVLARFGVRAALVNASGDVTLGDPPPGEKGWSVGVASLNPKTEPNRILKLSNCAIATSGDAWQYVEIDGKRYSHIVDPRTGLGLMVRSSVTIIATDGMTADSYASAVSVLGPVDGIKLAKETAGVEGVILYREAEQECIRHTAGFPQ